MVNVYLLLGSNLGNRQSYLNDATALIVAQAGQVVQQSGIYETQSWGKTNAPDYLNQVVLLQTQLSAQKLLAVLQQIEKTLGRERIEKWGNRTIDIDILFYGDDIINEPDLVVPHPHLHQRRFTLEPMVEINPNFMHPIFKNTVKTLKSELTDTLEVKKL